MSAAQPQTSTSLAQQHLGMIAKLALHYWRLLPSTQRAVYDVEELIQEGVAKVVQAQPRYNSQLAAEGTFVYTVVNHHFGRVYGNQRRKPEAARIEDSPQIAKRPVEDASLDWATERPALEALLEQASPAAARVLQAFLYRRMVNARVKPAVLEELQSLVNKCGVTPHTLRAGQRAYEEAYAI